MARAALADITGVETIKTLVACLSVPDFTVDELAQQTGVSRRTVDTVVRRYQHAFDKLPNGKHGAPGRPPVRWHLRTDHMDEVLAAVDSHQSALGVGWRAEVADPPGSDMAEASLIMAAAAIARTSDDAGQAKQLVAAARNSLATAGFRSDGSPWPGQPDQELADKELAGRARFIAAVADVVDACLSDDQKRIDEAQARAMPHVLDAARYMSATEWMPLAQKVVIAPGTVLSAPVLVGKGSVKYFHRLFPTLRAFLRKEDVPPGFVFMTDTRAEHPAASIPVTSLLNFKDTAETKLKWVDTARRPDCVVVSSKPEVLEPVAEYGARFILHRKNMVTKTEIANVVNSRAAWRVGLPGAVISSPGGAMHMGHPTTPAWPGLTETPWESLLRRSRPGRGRWQIARQVVIRPVGKVATTCRHLRRFRRSRGSVGTPPWRLPSRSSPAVSTLPWRTSCAGTPTAALSCAACTPAGAAG